jgi:hypothetical protein
MPLAGLPECWRVPCHLWLLTEAAERRVKTKWASLHPFSVPSNCVTFGGLLPSSHAFTGLNLSADPLCLSWR